MSFQRMIRMSQMQKRCCKLSPQDQPRKRHSSTQSLGVCATTFFLETYKRINNWTVLKLPSWFMGARFKRYAQEWYPLVHRSVKTPYDKVKRELVSATGSNDPQPPKYAYLGYRHGNSLRRREHHIEPQREFNQGRHMGCRLCPSNHVFCKCRHGEFNLSITHPYTRFC